eukprot:5952412-Pyramimonas_sp.AAC.1
MIEPFERGAKPRKELLDAEEEEGELFQRAAAVAAMSIEEVSDAPGMGLDVSGLSRGLMRWPEEGDGGPGATRRRIEPAIERT